MEEGGEENRLYKLRERRKPPEKLEVIKEKKGNKHNRWIAKLKSNPEDYEQFKQKDRLRCKLYRALLTSEKRKEYNEKAKLRMRKMREKKGKETKVKTRKTVEKEREYWRLKKREQRANLTGQGKRRELENRRRQYHERKTLKCKVKLDFERKSYCEQVKKVSDRMSKPEEFAEEINNIMEKATPRKKAALKDKGIIFTPRSKERYRLNKTVCERMKHVLDRYKGARKECRNVRRQIIKSLVGKSYKDHRLRRELNIKWDYWSRVSLVSGEEVKRSDAMSDEKIEHVKQFYKDESQILPDKRYASVKTGKSKRLMGHTLRQAHARYMKKYPASKLSLSKFQKLRPKETLTVSRQKFIGCLCEYCLNVQYKLDKMNSIAKAIGREDLKINNKYEVISQTLCKSDTEFHKPICVNRKCKDCGITLLKSHFKPLLSKENNTLYDWKRWGQSEMNGKKRQMLLDCSGSLLELVEGLCVEVDKLAKHLFVAQWQYKQFSKLTKCVPENWLIMVADFAENYRCTHQDEIQSAYYQYQQVTIHPIVAYYRCDKCDEVTCESAVFISADLVHDAYAVEHFTRTYQEHLKAREVKIKKKVLFSDGCASQYKSKLPFFFLSENSSNFERAYFGSRHGKGPCDGVGGVVKKSAETYVKSRQGTIRTPKEFYEFCQKSLQRGNELESADCLHKKRVFFYVEQIKRPEPKALKTLAGTRSIHSARGIESGLVEVRELSCYCQQCQNNNHEACENEQVVGSWKCHTLLFEGKVKMSKGKFPNKNTHATSKKNKEGGIKNRKSAEKTVHKEKMKGKEKTLQEEVDDKLGDACETETACHARKRLSSRNEVKKSTIKKGKNVDLNLKNIKSQLEAELSDTLPPEADDYTFVNTNKCIHRESVGMVPNDLPIESKVQLYPAEIYGDGNCLPRCGSFLLYGHENYHLEIRKRITMEMIINKQLYLDNETMRKGKCSSGSDDVIKTFALYSSQYTGGRLTNADIEIIYDKEVIEILQSGTWMGVWQLAALATILRRPVASVYPTYGCSHTIRSDIHRVFHPLNSSETKPVYIMWTNLDGPTVPESHFTTNHFVVLLPMILDDPTIDNDDFSMEFSEGEEVLEDDSILSLIEGLDVFSPDEEPEIAEPDQAPEKAHIAKPDQSTDIAQIEQSPEKPDTTQPQQSPDTENTNQSEGSLEKPYINQPQQSPEIRYNVGTHILVNHGSQNLPAVVVADRDETSLDLGVWVSYFKKWRKNWIFEERKYFILFSDIVQGLSAPSITCSGSRIYYTFPGFK